VRILFGPEHDALHVDPATPGAYEWWYFDALSDDGQWALVVIYFLGSPMSPYYKAVVDGKAPDPRDWCGVFVSLHEKGRGKWKERAYAYNLYKSGEFATDRPEVTVGGSRMTYEDAGDGRLRWRLTVNERGLWRGRTRAELTFTTPGPPLTLPPMGDQGDSADHSWVCVAPVCHAEGTVMQANGAIVPFTGNGYHDHNFGCLPFAGFDTWYWCRGNLITDEGKHLTAILYLFSCQKEGEHGLYLLFDSSAPAIDSVTGLDVLVSCHPVGITANSYGLRHFQHVSLSRGSNDGYVDVVDRWFARRKQELGTIVEVGANWSGEAGVLSEGPFYRRMVTPMHCNEWDYNPGTEILVNDESAYLGGESGFRHIGDGMGIGEVFRPARLCGPIASRAMWSRIRRRSSP
jgi:carotenoid 1,2-hydratase